MPYQIEMFSQKDAFRSSDNRGLGEILPKSKALPFVKWAGGKRSIVDKISEVLPPSVEIYHEPFVGGGAVFFAFEQMIKSATLADLNEELVLAYHTVAKDTDNLIEALQEHERNHQKEKNYYMKVRRQDPRDTLSIAARFLYLNKTCFNGLYRVNKSGKFNVPQGKYKNPKICNPENLKRVSEVLKKAIIHVGQFDITISPRAGDFVYCDPPYDGTFSEYHAEGFENADQERLKQSVDKWTNQGASVMISNSDTPFIRELYKGYNIHPITALRNISSDSNKRGQVSEVLITNYDEYQNTCESKR